MAYVIDVLPLDDPYIGAIEWGGYVWTNTGTHQAPVSIGYFLANDYTTWFPVERTAVANALQSWANVANITFFAASSAANADLIEHSVSEATIGAGLYGEHGTPEDAFGSTNSYDGALLLGGNTYAHGYFNYEAFGWDENDTNGGLSIGGNGYWTLIHELGHGLGLAHPHDDGGGSTLFPGVTNSGTTGDNGLNQGIWTVMSYIATQDPSSANTSMSNANALWYSGGNAVGNYGYYAGPMAFDIAAIQDLYGANTSYHTGSDTYALPDQNAVGTYWTCIWDAGGSADNISYSGSRNVTISLVAATLDNSSTGGGVISFATGIHGGYTIANGVVIENAYAGSGNDTLTGNSVGNILDGGAGADTMTGGGGNDTYWVDSFSDVIVENGGGTDTVNVRNITSYTLGANLENLNDLGSPSANFSGYGNSLNNLIQTYHGNDILDGRGGADTMQGYNGNDTYYVDNVGDVILESLNQGSDWAYVYLTSYTLTTNVENLNYIGNSSSDFVGTGNGLNNTMIGWSGNDYLDGLAGADTMRGLSGNDTYYVDNVGDVVDEGLNGGNDWIEVYLTSYTLPVNVENLNYIGTSTSNFSGAGNALANYIIGWSGNDVLNGLVGTDTLQGLSGDDTYYVDNVGDVVIEGAGSGSDNVVTSVSYTLAAGQQIETLRTIGTATTTALNLTGNGFVNTILGNNGANVLNGGAGADTAWGYGGNDTFYVDNAGDRTIEVAGGGNDNVVTSVSYALAAGQQIETLRTMGTATTTTLNLTGNELANTILGNNGANVLNGGAGADTAWGYGGNDTFYVDNAGDKVIEAAGGGNDNVVTSVSYALAAEQQIETLRTMGTATTTALNLTGNEIANTIIGNNGANVLNGGAGADTLLGYGGNDRFVFNTALSAATNVDRIADFNVANDTIALENAVFTALSTAGALASVAFFTGAAAHDADDRIVYNSTTGALSYDSDGTGATAAIQFATLAHGLALTNNDFLVV